MEVIFYGTRGSVPVSGGHVAKYGGNTTCLHIKSVSLPSEYWLIVDAGTGIVPLGSRALTSNIQTIMLLMTHYHHDHTQGFLLCPMTFDREIKFHCYGPAEDGRTPLTALKDMMSPPYFPLPFTELPSQISGEGITSPADIAIVIHPEGGFRLISTEELESIELLNPFRILINEEYYYLRECLVIRMQRTNHPQKTFTYRFEERATERTMVFVTDHENVDGMPQYLRRHLQDADLLIMDSQYDRETYDRETVGFGHGTPDYCVRVANEMDIPRLGITHHDPFSSDGMVDAILHTAQEFSKEVGFEGEIFACADYLSVHI